MPRETAIGALIDSLAGLLLLAFILRFLFQYLRLEFANPLVRVLVIFTDPPLRPLRRWLPKMPGLRGVDPAVAAFIWLLSLVKLTAPLLLAGYDFRWFGALIVSLANAANAFVWVFIVAVLARVVVSWVARDSYHPAVHLIYQLSAPPLIPIARFLPAFGGLDFSPIVALLGLRMLQNWLIAPVTEFGFRLMY